MHRGYSHIINPNNSPGISSGAAGPATYRVYDEVVNHWSPIGALDGTAGLGITDVLNRFALLGSSSPACERFLNQTATSASHANGPSMLPPTPQSGYTQAPAHKFTGSVTRQGILYEELYQSVYAQGLPSEAFRLPKMLYQGIGLGDALRNDFRRLADHDQEAWPANLTFEVPQKLAVVFCFPGYDKYSRQVNVLRHVRGRTFPPTRSKLAHIIAGELQSFLNLAHSSGKALVHGGRHLGLDDLVLVDIKHISRGSLQPTFGVVVQPPYRPHHEPPLMGSLASSPTFALIST